MLDKILHGVLATLLGMFLLSAGYVTAHLTKTPTVVEQIVEKPVEIVVEKPKVLDAKLCEALEFLRTAERARFYTSSSFEYLDGERYPTTTFSVEVTPADSTISVEYDHTYRTTEFTQQNIIDHILKVKEVHTQ